MLAFAIMAVIRQSQADCGFIEGGLAHLHFLFLGPSTRVFNFAPESLIASEFPPFDPEFLDSHLAMCERLFFLDPLAQATAASHPPECSRADPQDIAWPLKILESKTD